MKIGKLYDIFVEGYDGEYYIGRNYEMVLDIDVNILFKLLDSIEIGIFIRVKIIKNMDYDLVGVVVDEFCK